MEKEIEIIKSLINDLKKEEKLIGYDAEVEIQALKNLIKGYKEIEGELNKLNSYILINGIDEGLKTATQIKLENQSQYLHQKQVENLKEKIEYLKANYIPISKIKEKIEELKNENYQIILGSEIAFDSEIFKNNLKIQVLQELMEE